MHSGQRVLEADNLFYWQPYLFRIYILFFLLTSVAWYYHTIYLEFTYFASFTDYEGDISEIISNLHIQGSKFGGKIYKFAEKSFKKLNSEEFM